MVYVVVCSLLFCVIKRCKLHCFAILFLKRVSDQPVCQLRVLGKQRAVKIGSDHVLINYALIACLAVVSGAVQNFSKGLAVVDAGPSAVVLKAYDGHVKKVAFQHDVADQASLALLGIKIHQIKACGIKGTGVMLNLAKNPAGFNQNISAVMQDKSPKDIIITINDNAQDGTDISWLWDVDFDLLGNESIRSITVSGIRCQDMRLRLKYVDIPSILEGDVEKAIRDRVEDGVGNLYVLVNYTALFSTRNILKKLEGEKA